MKGISWRLFFLLPLCIMAALAVPSISEAEDVEIHVKGIRHYAQANEVITRVNVERAQAGAKPLVLDAELSRVAMERAAEISIYFEHERPDGSYVSACSPKASGENISVGARTAEYAMTAWLNSPGHRANIMNPYFQSIGVGCFQNGEVWYWVQVFGYGAASGTDEVQTDDDETVSMVVSADSAYLTIYAYKILRSSLAGCIFVGERCEVMYGWDNKTGFAYGVGIAQDFVFSTDTPDILRLDEKGGYVGIGEGTGVIRISLKGVPAVTWTAEVPVRKADVSEDSFFCVQDVQLSYPYTGESIRPVPKVIFYHYDPDTNKRKATELTEGADYTISWGENIKAGKGSITVQGIGLFKGTRTHEFEIEKLPYTGVQAQEYREVYDGKAHGITLSGLPDNAVVEYSLDNENWSSEPILRSEVGQSWVYYRVSHAYYETVSGVVFLEILPRKIWECTAEEIADQVYTGEALEPKVVLRDGDKLLTEGIDYELHYRNNIRAGEGQITVCGLGLYDGKGVYKKSKTLYFRIIRDINTLSVREIPTQYYYGEELCPEVEIWDSDWNRNLIWGKEYERQYENTHQEQGTARMTITAMGNYFGTRVVEYNIVDARPDLPLEGGDEPDEDRVERINLGTLKIVPFEEQAYTGEQVNPTVLVYDGEKLLKENVDFVCYRDTAVDPGEHKLHISGIGDYAGYETLSFWIVKDGQAAQPGGSSGSGSGAQSGAFPGGGSGTQSGASPGGSEDGDAVSFGQGTDDFDDMSDEEPENDTEEQEQPDTAKKKISVPGRPAIKSLVCKSGKKIKVTLKKKVSGADGYQVSYAKKKNLKGAKAKNFTGTSVTVKGLKGKAKYYVRVRAYKKSGSRKIYGKWSIVKAVKVNR